MKILRWEVKRKNLTNRADCAEPDWPADDRAGPDDIEPDGAEPVGAEPDGMEPDGAEPVGAEPDGMEPDGARSTWELFSSMVMTCSSFWE